MKKLILFLYISALSVSFTCAAYVTKATSAEIQAPSETEGSGCTDCHQKTYSSVVTKSFPHSAGIKDCIKCHKKQVETEKEIPVESYARENLIILDVSDYSYYSVRVRVKDREGSEAVSSELKFAPTILTANVINDKTPPLISNLRVEELKEGVFYSAALAWDTNEFSTTAGEYGLQGGSVTMLSRGERYSKDHNITLTGLKSGEVYIFRSISKDPFGNIARSEDLRVDIKNPFSDESDESGETLSVEEVNMIKVGEKTALRWKTNKETVGIVELSEYVHGEKLSNSF